MPQISQVLARLPNNIDVHISTMGHVVWVCWHNTVPPAVGQILMTYGGMLVVEDDTQAVWFFFTDDVFLALARLMVWGNFHTLPIAVELFPGRLLFGRKGEINVWLDGQLHAQNVIFPDNLEVWIHPKSREGKKNLPGITFERRAGRPGMSTVDWATMTADVRMPYASTQSWFALVHPLGSPLDKGFQEGWDAMYKTLGEIIQRHKMKSLYHETFLILLVENLMMLRNFMRDYLQAFNVEGNEHWPCVCVVADRGNLNFNIELPKKIGLKWNNLAPDFPYLTYRNAYLLGEGFSVRDLRYSGDQASVEEWCNIMLHGDTIAAKTLPLLMPGYLTAENASGVGCVYCGLQSHESALCPTRHLPPSDSAIWDALAEYDLDAINTGFKQIETALTSQGMDGYAQLLAEEGVASVVLNAVLDIEAVGQLRNVPQHWLNRMHTSDAEDGEPPQRDDSPSWGYLDRLMQASPGDLIDLSKKALETEVRYPRDSRLRMVMGFIYLERKDFEHAILSFKDAVSLTASPFMQAWNEFFIARIYEEQGQFTQAVEQYAKIQRVMPNWRDVRYRAIVCRVKMGFCEPVLDTLARLIHEDPTYFNRALVDPALERGRLLILSTLHDLAEDAKNASGADRKRMVEMCERINEWFPQDHPVQLDLGARLRALNDQAGINSYMMSLRVKAIRPELERELEEHIEHEVEDLRNRYKYYLDILQEIRDEASWFPFPGALKEFSHEFNECAGIINRAFSSNFREAAAFKSSRDDTPRLVELLRSLRKRLKSLRMVRDGTLFGLTFLKTFAWAEAVGLLLCFITIPLIYFWGESIHLGWLKNLLGSEPWSIQKVLVVIVTVMSIGIAALRTTVVFDKKKEKLLAEARRQREQAQQSRLERVRQQRRLSAAHPRAAENNEEA